MIAILDYGIGNVSSIKNMLKRIGIDSVITPDKGDVESAAKIILPGVGSFDYCMKQLKASAFYDTLLDRVLVHKVPVLGVCVGCQMLMESSEEGVEEGLGWVKGKVVKFDATRLPEDHKVPHMGWAAVKAQNECPLYRDTDQPRFYFVHSYHVLTQDAAEVTATATYGYDFTASVQKGNIYGVQFHPEKSHKFGMKLYENFNRYC